MSSCDAQVELPVSASVAAMNHTVVQGVADRYVCFLVSQDWRINSTAVPCIVVARVEPGSGNRHDSIIAGLILLFSQAPSASLGP